MNALRLESLAGPRRRTAALGLALTALVSLAGCGGSDSGSSTAKPRAQSSGGGSGTNVTVEESEFTLKLSTTTFSPGTYTFTAKDVGKQRHALEIEGPGVEEQKTQTLDVGGSASLTVKLKKGKYELYCPVDHHKDMGMKIDITVA